MGHQTQPFCLLFLLPFLTKEHNIYICQSYVMGFTCFQSYFLYNIKIKPVTVAGDSGR